MYEATRMAGRIECRITVYSVVRGACTNAANTQRGVRAHGESVDWFILSPCASGWICRTT
jgi:hypothetical protein